MKTKLLILALVLAISIGLIASRSRQQAQAVFAQEQENAALLLQRERADYERELAQLEEQLRSVYQGQGSYVLLLERPDQSMIELAEQLKERGATAVVALSHSAYPGAEGCISREEFDDLLEQGWRCCLYWDGKTDLPEAVESARPVFEALGQPLPTALYVANGGYYTYKDDQILEAGFTIVVHHGEVRSLIAREDSETLFPLGAVRWNDPVIRPLLVDMSQYGGALAAVVDFETRYGEYDSEKFTRMLDYLEDEAMYLVSTDLEGARQSTADSFHDSYPHQRRDWLAAEIARIDDLIAQVYATQPEQAG